VTQARTGWDVTPTSTVADALMAILKLEGIGFLSCYPTTPLIDAAARRDLRPVLCRQERVGVGIADGYSRMTSGQPPGVFAMQWGPGVENAYAGIATAFADSSPVLLLPLGYGNDQQDMPRFHNIDRLRPVAKSVERLRSPERLSDVMRRAFAQLRSARPGPVVVEIPMDLASAPVGERLRPYQPVPATRSAGDPDAIERAAELLAGASRPVLLAGGGVLQAGASEALRELAEWLDAPVGTTLAGKSAFDEEDPRALGTGSLTATGPFRACLAEADVVLAVGTSLTRHFLSALPPSRAAVIHVSNDEADLHKDCAAACAILGDAKLVLQQLSTALQERLQGRRLERGTLAVVAERRRQWLAEWEPQLASHEVPISHYRVVDALGKVLDPRRSVLTHDSGSPRDQMLPFYRARAPRSYLGWGKSHALGTGLGLVMGAKLARPDWTCVNVMGDAAFGMVGLDFETAVRNAIPITTVVLNNGTMAIETEALADSHERFRSRDVGGRYADLARAMGGWARRVEDPREIEAALREACEVNAGGQPALVEFITSPAMTPFSHRPGRGESGGRRA
jgi:acetolactate synthase I/II/III large subunit